jgi:ceramide glucosyltransferase
VGARLQHFSPGYRAVNCSCDTPGSKSRACAPCSYRCAYIYNRWILGCAVPRNSSRKNVCLTNSRYSAINFIGLQSMIIGKSNLYRKADMEKCGGMQQFAKYMSEDNEIGKSLMNLGRTHQIAPELAYQSMGHIKFQDFLKRRIRWIRIRKYVVFIATAVEPFCECLVNTSISSYLFHGYFNMSMISFFTTYISLWFCSDMLMLALTYSPDHGHTPRSMLETARVWLLRECMGLIIWITGMMGTEIQWRGVSYRCNSDGTGVPVLKPAK